MADEGDGANADRAWEISGLRFGAILRPEVSPEVFPEGAVGRFCPAFRVPEAEYRQILFELKKLYLGEYLNSYSRGDSNFCGKSERNAGRW